jgi:hypothetical protein
MQRAPEAVARMGVVVADTGGARTGRCANEDEAEADWELIRQAMGMAVGHTAKRDDLKLMRHCERSQAIHCAAWVEWIASSLSLLAMTENSGTEPKIIMI